MRQDKSKIFLWIFIVCVTIVACLAIGRVKADIGGDGLTYTEAIAVLDGQTPPEHFIPNRILTTFLGLKMVDLSSRIFGSVEVGWIMLNIIFFFIFNILFYHIVLSIFKSERVALLSSLFLLTSYGMMSFGIDYWMDTGGWMFYMASLYLTLQYAQTGNKKLLCYSALVAGIGGLFKEYSLLAAIPIAVLIIYENWPSFKNIVKNASLPALIFLIPISAVFIFVFEKFDYTYIDWLSSSKAYYVYSSKTIEYIKALGSLYNILAFAVIGGLYYFIKNRCDYVPDKKVHILIIAVAVSVLPLFIWPAIVQRILFITVPAGILFAAFLFRRFEHKWWLFLFPLLLYSIINFNMNYILINFNLPF